MKDGKPDKSPEAMAKLESIARKLSASNTGFIWNAEYARLNVTGYAFPETMIATQRTMDDERWKKSSAATAEVARSKLLAMAATGNVTFDKEGKATINLRGMSNWNDRKETAMMLGNSGLAPEIDPDTPPKDMVIPVTQDGRTTQERALNSLRIDPKKLDKDGVAFKDMAEAAAFIGAQERSFRAAKMELPEPIKKIAKKLKDGGDDLTKSDIAAMLEFKKNLPLETKRIAEVKQQKSNDDPFSAQKDFCNDMCVTMLDQIKGIAASGDINLLMEMNKALVQANQKAGKTDVRDPKTYATLGNLQQKIEYLNDGLSPGDKKYIDLKKIFGEKGYDTLAKGMKMNSDTLLALAGGPNAPAIVRAEGQVPITPGMTLDPAKLGK